MTTESRERFESGFGYLEALGGHFGFWPLLAFAHTFVRGIGAHFFLNTSKYPNPLSNLSLLSVVMGGPNMTLLYAKIACMSRSICMFAN